jgi:hypothetical protein
VTRGAGWNKKVILFVFISRRWNRWGNGIHEPDARSRVRVPDRWNKKISLLVIINGIGAIPREHVISFS